MALSARKVPALQFSEGIRLIWPVPGTLPPTGDETLWPAAIQTQGLTTVEWRILDPRDAPRSAWNTLTDARLTSASGAPLLAPFRQTGDLLEVRKPGDSSIYTRSSRVRLLRPDPLEPPTPLGWAVHLYDRFTDKQLDRGRWRQVVANARFDPALIRLRRGPGGLTLQAARRPDGQYACAAIQAGSSSLVGSMGWGDVQVSVKCRFDKGQGVGARVSLVPLDASKAVPRMDMIQTRGADKTALGVANYWKANAADAQAIYPVDLTQTQIVTVRRSAGRWNVWINQAEQVVPAAWAQQEYLTPLTLRLETTAVDTSAASPALFNAFFDYVRVSGPV